MTRLSGNNRRKSTIVRDNAVHDAYDELCGEYGKLAHLLPRKFIYETLSRRTGLCAKTIAFILNHTNKENLTNGGG